MKTSWALRNAEMLVCVHTSSWTLGNALLHCSFRSCEKGACCVSTNSLNRPASSFLALRLEGGANNVCLLTRASSSQQSLLMLRGSASHGFTT